ncbi:MAG: dihydrolipoyllysine-residue acetyltransferase [Gammaproteobacteria bacterium]|nr:dihydrolipoyllysine-residue acetyltransferase [Gammaproteobacteria bacterium]
MSDFNVLIPDVGEAQDVEVIEVCVKIGQQVEVDDALLVIESDKASMEVPSPRAGKVKSIEVKLGDIIDTGDLVAVLEVAATEEKATKERHSSPIVDPHDGPVPAKTEESVNEAEAIPHAATADGHDELFEIRLPELGDVDDVEVIEVLVEVGQTVSMEQALIVLESDKATMEIPSTVAGVLESLEVAVGDKVTDHTLVAVINVPAGQSGSIATKRTTVETSTVAETLVEPKPTTRVEVDQPSTREGAEKDRGSSVYAGPAVRRLARELGVDLALVEGSGVRGRIVKDDVKLHVKTAMLKPALAETSAGLPEVEYPDFTRFGETEETPLTRMQSRGAENLVRSWLNVVHVTQHDEADVTELEEFRVELNEQGQLGEQRLTALPFILKACASTLREHPRFNASISPTLKSLILKKYIHVGVAVDTPDGLVVPVIRDVLDKGLRDIATELEALSTAARSKKLTPDQISGSSFTVSSLGRIGGTGFTPIINAPEVAILGVARLATKPVWDGSAFEPRKILPLSLSYDHRAINGAEGGRFMQSLVEKLGDVRRLIL